MRLLVSVEANIAASVFPLVLHFLFMVAILWGSFATCVQREQSPHHSAWQTRSSEDQKPFLAWNVLWNVFENKVVNDNCHQKLALSNAFFIVSRPQKACLVLRSQMVRMTDNHAYLSVCRHTESTPRCLIAHLSPTCTPTVPRGRWEPLVYTPWSCSRWKAVTFLGVCGKLPTERLEKCPKNKTSKEPECFQSWWFIMNKGGGGNNPSHMKSKKVPGRKLLGPAS